MGTTLLPHLFPEMAGPCENWRRGVDVRRSLGNVLSVNNSQTDNLAVDSRASRERFPNRHHPNGVQDLLSMRSAEN